NGGYETKELRIRIKHGSHQAQRAHQQASGSRNDTPNEETGENTLETHPNVLKQLTTGKHLLSSRQHHQRTGKELGLERRSGNEVPEENHAENRRHIEDMLSADFPEGCCQRATGGHGDGERRALLWLAWTYRFHDRACSSPSIRALICSHMSPKPGLPRR